jgi:Tol biopolymer transport system component
LSARRGSVILSPFDMDDPVADAAQAGGDADLRLESWKAIAAYLGRGVTTVQRWEREEGLPVRRHAHAARGSVFALRRELDEWRRSREATGLPSLPAADANPVDRPRDEAGAPAAAPVRRRRRLAFAAVAGAGAMAIAALSAAAWWPGPAPAENPASASAFAARALPRGPVRVHRPSLSPDGSRVLYGACGSGGCRLLAQPIAGGPAEELPIDAPRPARRVDHLPRWSPDRSQFALLREIRNSIWELRLVAAGGGASRALLVMATGAMAWLPDGASLVILDRPSQSEPFAAYLVSAATGARQRRLTTPAAGTFGDWQCDVSPDGRLLAVVRYRTSHQADIWAIDLQTGAERRLTSGMNELDGVAWTPDAATVIFSAADAAGSSLWTVAANPRPGERPLRVAGTEGGAKGPTVARRPGRGGAAVAFVNEATSYSLWRWDRRTSPAARRLTSSPAPEQQPAISPDGHRVAFVSSRSGGPEIWVDAIEGGSARQLTFRGEPVATPRWSVDGRSIVFASWTGDNEDVFTVRADGSGSPWRITFEPSGEDNPSWSRDGRSIYFRSDRDGRSRIYRVPGSGGLETFVVPSVWERWWDVTADGVIAWQHSGEAQSEPVTVRLFDMRGGGRDLGTLPTPFATLALGVSASRNGEVLMWGTDEAKQSAIMVSTASSSSALLASTRP